MSNVELIKSISKIKFNEKLYRITWKFTWALLASWTPKVFLNWRVFLLRLFGAKIGEKVLVFGSLRVDLPKKLTIGNYSAIGKNVWLYNFADIYIGSNTVISQSTTICTASHDYLHPYMSLYAKPIKIGDSVWVTANCFILPGINIADGAVIGACSVVTKSIESWSINAGNPCKFISKRELVEKDFQTKLQKYYL